VVNLDILPKGLPPGKWGISSMQTLDRAGNFRSILCGKHLDLILPSPMLETRRSANRCNLNEVVAYVNVGTVLASIS
jgi:hypothetical protein